MTEPSELDAGAGQEPAAPAAQAPAGQEPSAQELPSDVRWTLRIEIVLVLGVSVGYSAISSTISFVQTFVRYHGFRGTVSSLNTSRSPDHHWFDLAYQLLGSARGIAFAGLALYLLSRTPAAAAAITKSRASGGFGIGVDGSQKMRDVVHGAMLATIIGIPGLALYFTARALGLNATIATSGLPDVWWRYPVLVLSAFQNGALEEIVWVGFLVTRFRQLGWTDQRAIGVSAFIRGCYHLYQGFGGFIGNLVMGVVYGFYFTRSRRVMPLVIAHAIQDTVVFVGYALLSPQWSFIR